MAKYSIKITPGEVAANLAERHRQLRKAAGYSQAELAKRSGVSLGSLKRFEQTGRISLENLLRLGYLLDRLEDFTGVFQVPEDMGGIEKLFSDKMRGG